MCYDSSAEMRTSSSRAPPNFHVGSYLTRTSRVTMAVLQNTRKFPPQPAKAPWKVSILFFWEIEKWFCGFHGFGRCAHRQRRLRSTAPAKIGLRGGLPLQLLERFAYFAKALTAISNLRGTLRRGEGPVAAEPRAAAIGCHSSEMISRVGS